MKGFAMAHKNFLDEEDTFFKEVRRVESGLTCGPRYPLNVASEEYPKTFKIFDSNGRSIQLSNKTGIYVYWSHGKVLYVGESSTCLRDRVGHFIAAIWGKSHIGESHGGGNVHRMLYGKGNFDGLMYSFVKVDIRKFNTRMIESEVVSLLQPLYLNHMNEYRMKKTQEKYDGTVTLDEFMV
jgi:hypothetical protein